MSGYQQNRFVDKAVINYNPIKNGTLDTWVADNFPVD